MSFTVYPHWSVASTYTPGCRVSYKGRAYLLQPSDRPERHTSLSDEPGVSSRWHDCGPTEQRATTQAAVQTAPQPDLKSVVRLLQMVDILQVSKEWMLIAPNGDVYRGPPDDMLRVLLPHSRLLGGA